MNRNNVISRLRNRYLTMRLLETVGFAAGAALAVAGVLVPWQLPTVIVTAAAVVAFCVVAVARIQYLQIRSLDENRIASWLNAKYPVLKESTDLLIRRESELNTLEQLQLRKVNQAIDEVRTKVKFPQQLPGASTALVIGAAILFFSSSFVGTNPGQQVQTALDRDSVSAPGALHVPSLEKITIGLVPPAYTGISKSTTTGPHFRIAEGTAVTWNVSFSSPPDSARINFSNGQRVALTATAGDYNTRRSILLPLLYQVEWFANGKAYTSDYARIDVKPDQPPAVAIVDMPQFTRLMWGEKNDIEIQSTIRDDYAISSAHIIATVSKGSGESVKFREEKLGFTSPAAIRGSNITARRIIDFKKLGMEPGDEVYFYVEAFDNRQPVPQRSRTETFFVALLDTAAADITVDSGLGIDLMPDYFRSQRQLIIDTEKLIAEQSKISKHQFNSTSNELGYDQKVLRLRYGQFMGEEFETAIGQPTNVQEAVEEEEEEDLMKQYGHQHDTENEHNLVADKKQPKEPDGHQHEEEEGDEDDPMAAFRHDHDSEDVATFFNQSIKAKLRAALSLMWDSELQLRLYQPKASLPYQYQILKLLKEIAQDSRIYVHRMGFDPPPLKEDRRLTADLDEIHNSRVGEQTAAPAQYPGIAQAIHTLNTALEAEQVVVTPETRVQLQAAGNELASIAISNPGNFLDALSAMKAVVDGNVDDETLRPKLEIIQSALLQAIPGEDATATRRSRAVHPLELKLMQEMKKRPNE